ncbi:MAG: hypothetical protein ACXVCY_03600 [Pseudobdellovibrionaceae bacterium]
MKHIVFALTLIMVGNMAAAMPCDTGWSCKSKSGKYSVQVQRCRYTNSIRNLESIKIGGQEIANAKISAAYDSLSIGGKVLAFEISIPDTKNDAHYLSFEYMGKKGQVTERVQPYNPGPQKVIASETLTCEEAE